MIRDRLVREFGPACQVCGAPSELCVDHDHETGLVRGLLCLRCNTAEGNGSRRFEDWRKNPPAAFLALYRGRGHRYARCYQCGELTPRKRGERRDQPEPHNCRSEEAPF